MPAGFGQYLLLLPVIRGLDALRLRMRDNATCLNSLNNFIVTISTASTPRAIKNGCCERSVPTIHQLLPTRAPSAMRGLDSNLCRCRSSSWLRPRTPSSAETRIWPTPMAPKTNS